MVNRGGDLLEEPEQPGANEDEEDRNAEFSQRLTSRQRGSVVYCGITD
jgi:hypothetical protein